MNNNEPLSKRKHGISSAMANKYIETFQQKFKATNEEGMPYYESFNKEAILKLLAKKDCAGLRIYNGIKTENNTTEVVFVLMAIDKDGNVLSSNTKTKPTFAEAKDGDGGGDDDGEALNNGQKPPTGN